MCCPPTVRGIYIEYLNKRILIHLVDVMSVPDGFRFDVKNQTVYYDPTADELARLAAHWKAFRDWWRVRRVVVVRGLRTYIHLLRTERPSTEPAVIVRCPLVGAAPVGDDQEGASRMYKTSESRSSLQDIINPAMMVCKTHSPN